MFSPVSKREGTPPGRCASSQVGHGTAVRRGPSAPRTDRRTRDAPQRVQETRRTQLQDPRGPSGWTDPPESAEPTGRRGRHGLPMALPQHPQPVPRVCASRPAITTGSCHKQKSRGPQGVCGCQSPHQHLSHGPGASEPPEDPHTAGLPLTQNLITSTKTLFPIKVVFRGSRDPSLGEPVSPP